MEKKKIIIECNGFTSKVFINGKQLEHVKSVSFSHNVDSEHGPEIALTYYAMDLLGLTPNKKVQPPESLQKAVVETSIKIDGTEFAKATSNAVHYQATHGTREEEKVKD